MSNLKLWKSFSLFMVLLLMSSLVAVVPARPVQANVSSITVNPYDTRIISANTGYRIIMTTGASLNAGDNVTIVFPADTTIPELSGTPGNVFVQDTPCVAVAVAGQEVTVTVPAIAIVPGQPFMVTFNKACLITNPNNSGSKTMTVWTTVEPTHVTSSAYEITAVKVYSGATYLSQHATIAAAIAAASAGNTITVPSGTFTEDLVINKANLTLNSVSGRDSTTIQLVDGIGIEIDTGADNFKLGGATGHGFTIASSTGAGTTRDIQLTHSIPGVQISYNRINTTGGASMGINIGAAGATGLTISNNNFTAEAGDGSIWADELGVNTVVSNNTFTGPGGLVSGYAVEFKGGTGTSVISNNTISGYSFGIGVLSGSSGTSGLAVSNNNVTGCVTGIAFAQYEAGNIAAVTVTGNILSSNTNGLRIWNGVDVDASQITVQYNNFVGNTTYGLRNDDAATSTAKFNYWGHASGPSQSSPAVAYGDNVSANVNFQPWLISTSTGVPPAGEIAISTASPLPSGSTGVAYSTALTAIGGTSPYTWAYYSGTLPTGLSIVGSNLSGTPTQVNTFNFAVQVSDGTQGTYQNFSMQVYGGALVITTTSPLSGGTIYVPYGPVQLQAVGGSPGSYNWGFDVGSGPLPNGLTLASDGKISGTPTAAGTFNFRVKLECGILTPGYKDLSITISAPSGVGQKLIGADDATANLPLGAGNLSLTKFQAAASDNVVAFRVKSDRIANVKVAIYADNGAGEPGALRGAVNTSTPIGVGWTSITITSTPVVSGNYYWLAINSETMINCATASPGGTIRYKAAPYAAFTTFPDPAGTGYSSASGIIVLLAGWRVSAPTSAPTVSNSTGASSVTQTSARLNGAVTGTGGEDPTAIIYWGDNNGGTTAYNWDNSVNLGTKGAVTFFTDITGLTPSSLYYYRCFAANTGGGAWAGSSENFTTSALSAPTVTNSTGASSISVTSARLNGVITGTGGENPTAIIYWGDNDGTTNANNWDSSVNLGVKGAVSIYTDISDLNINNKYYYRCFASNSVGNAWSDNSSTFTTLAGGVEQKLVGADDATANLALGAGNLSLTRFQAVASGDAVTFKVKSDRTANIKVAIYADNGAGEPGALRGAVNTSTPIGVGWTSITIASTPITLSNFYWLAINSDTTINCATASPGGTIRFKAAPYGAFTFPDPAGMGYSSASGIIVLLAGYTIGVVAAPPAAPTIATPKATITFAWDTVSGATKYRLQVNTASDFTGAVIFDNAAIGTTSQNVALTMGNTYYWRVKAGNAGGWSGWSATGSVTP